jgi:hypothetical protein
VVTSIHPFGAPSRGQQHKEHMTGEGSLGVGLTEGAWPSLVVREASGGAEPN